MAQRSRELASAPDGEKQILFYRRQQSSPTVGPGHLLR
jgi:hypothetical protein